MGVMNLSILLLASFSVFFIPACFGQVAVDTSGMACSGLDMSNGEYKTIITWECFANNTKACVTRTEDCSKCDGTFSMASSTHTFPDEEAVDDAEKPKEGEEPKEEAKEDEKEKEEKDKDEKPETKGGRLSRNFRRGKGRRSKPRTGRSEIRKDPISCATVCTKKSGKHVKGKVEYSTFKDCDGEGKEEAEGAGEAEEEKPKEYKEKDEKDGEEEKGEDKEEDKEKEKEKEDKAEKERRFRRMRRF